MFLIPLIKDACVYLYEWYKRNQELKKVKAENERLALELKNAKNKEEALKALNKL